MSIDISIPDDFIKDDERNKLEELFRCDEDHPFDVAISRVVLSSLAEYKDMLLGMRLPSRADEIRQHRLFHLIKHYFLGRLPSEAEVSSMFQLTQSRSRSLIRYVMTRFRYELEEEIRNTLIQNLQQARFNNDANEYRLVIQSDNVLEELNRIIATIAPALDPIRKVRNMSRTFAISEDSYRELRSYFGIER
jgi:hypothetical protein